MKALLGGLTSELPSLHGRFVTLASRCERVHRDEMTALCDLYARSRSGNSASHMWGPASLVNIRTDSHFGKAAQAAWVLEVLQLSFLRL